MEEQQAQPAQPPPPQTPPARRRGPQLGVRRGSYKKVRSSARARVAAAFREGEDGYAVAAANGIKPTTAYNYSKAGGSQPRKPRGGSREGSKKMTEEGVECIISFVEANPQATLQMMADHLWREKRIASTSFRSNISQYGGRYSDFVLPPLPPLTAGVPRLRGGSIPDASRVLTKRLWGFTKHHISIGCFLSVGFLFATSFGSATRVKIPRLRSPGCLVTRQPGGRKRGILPSPVDVPPGRYKSNSIPAELGKTNTTVVINYTPNRANARLFSVNELQETEEVERDFFELRRSSFQKPLETLGLAKCYYLSNGFRRGLQTRILERNATVYRTLLCTTLTSTRDNPQLVLYLHAVARKCGGYKDFGSPVFLTYQGAQGGYRAASSLLRRIAHVAAMSQPGDDGVSNKLAVDGIKDGTYVGNLTILSITTGADGRQRAMFTSHVNGWNLGTTLEDDLVASAEANYIPGCFKLKTVAITICPTDVGDLLMKGYGEEQMLYRVDSTQNSSPLLDDGPNNGSS